MKNETKTEPARQDITSSGGRAIAWHLRQGKDNGEISREALALWIGSICDKHDALTAALDGCVEALTNLVSLDDGDERLFWQGNGELFANAARAALDTAKKARD